MASLPTGNTRSTNAILEALRDQLLDYENVNGETVRDILEENLFRNRAPDNQEYPFGTLRLTTRKTPGYSGRRKDGKLEVTLYGRSSGQLQDISDAADRCEQAMLDYVSASSGGLMFTHECQRDELPQGGTPVDGETVTIRLLYTLAIWPAYLTSLTT